MNFSSLKSMLNLSNITDRLKNIIVEYTPLQLTVRKLTNDDPWCNSPQDMQQIASEMRRLSRRGVINDQQESSPSSDVLSVLMERWNNEQSTWRNIYKALALLEYLIKHGPEEFVEEARECVKNDLSRLSEYKHTDEKGKDQGMNVRVRAKAIMEIMESEESIATARSKARDAHQHFISRAAGSTTSSSFHSSHISDFPKVVNAEAEHHETTSVSSRGKSPKEPEVRQKDEPLLLDFEQNIVECSNKSVGQLPSAKDMPQMPTALKNDKHDSTSLPFVVAPLNNIAQHDNVDDFDEFQSAPLIAMEADGQKSPATGK